MKFAKHAIITALSLAFAFSVLAFTLANAYNTQRIYLPGLTELLTTESELQTTQIDQAFNTTTLRWDLITVTIQNIGSTAAHTGKTQVTIYDSAGTEIAYSPWNVFGPLAPSASLNLTMQIFWNGPTYTAYNSTRTVILTETTS
jgi:hypothetical protein